MTTVARDRHRRGDVEIAIAMACVLKDRGAGIGAIWNLGDQAAHMRLGHVQQFGDAGLNRLLAVFVHQADKSARPHLAGPDQRVEIALLVAPCAHVRQKQVDDVIARLALVPQLERRDTQTFGENLGGGGVIACGNRPADIGQVAFADGPEHQLALVEHRIIHAGVDDVRSAIFGIVVQDQVAVVDIALEILGDRFHRGDQAAKVDRKILPLQDHLGRVVEQRGGIVMRQIEDRRSRGLLQRQGHLALRGFQHAADDGQGDGVNLGF